MSCAGHSHGSRVGHRCGGGLSVGWLPVLVGKVAGDQQGGNCYGGEFVGEGVPAVHESDGPSYRLPIGIFKGAYHLRGPVRLCRNGIGEEQRIEQCFGDEAVGSHETVDQREGIRFRPPLATTDRSERCGDALFEEVFDRADRSVSTRVRAAAKAATERGEDPWSVFLAGWDAVLDTAIDESLQRIRVVDAPAVLGWQRWQELNARYTLANIEAGLVRLLEHGALAPQPVAPLAVLLMGLSNQAVAAIAGADQPLQARQDIGRAVRRLLEGLRHGF